MSRLALALLLLGGCSPLAAYSVAAFPYGKELFGKDMFKEAEEYAIGIERREAGFIVGRRGVLPYRNAVPRSEP